MRSREGILSEVDVSSGGYTFTKLHVNLFIIWRYIIIYAV